MTVSGVILAAGRGERFGWEKNKIFLQLQGRPILTHTVTAFLQSSAVSELVVVIREGEEEEVRRILAALSLSIRLVHGGETRRDSALAGVRASRGEIVLIHDAARPFPSQALIERVIEGARHHSAVVPVLSVTDTLLREARGRLLDPLDRRAWVRAQTPQGFRRALILPSLEAADPAVTDDASAVLAKGEDVHAVRGEVWNLKITHPEDLDLARAIAAQRTQNRE